MKSFLILSRLKSLRNDALKSDNVSKGIDLFGLVNDSLIKLESFI